MDKIAIGHLVRTIRIGIGALGIAGRGQRGSELTRIESAKLERAHGDRDSFAAGSNPVRYAIRHEKFFRALAVVLRAFEEAR
ncbi:hypothetical protein [Bradyrhizobium genomosp. I (2014)]|uniref:hypothetical protein n=1 Tax=Bradyrhizobium genomosp. I (2014) TaxID=2683269 RepID=UPI0005591822|nr:hypothetical protein [Bradyrhizobium sp. CCBAU 43298]